MRLSSKTLPDVAAGVARPAYERGAVTPGIVHLGVGAFHRAHQAVYVEDCLARGETGWGIIGASLRTPDMRDALAPQDGLYTLAVRDGEGARLRVIGALREVLVAPENPATLISRMADPAIRIVTLTVTEKGYCHDPASGALNEDHPDIVHDLREPAAPRSAPGLLVAALAARKSAGVAPFTVVSCDNLPANGRTVKRVLGGLAALHAPDLGRWVEDNVACPSTMVDRIVPATTPETLAQAERALGVTDAAAVAAEPFMQWVIEDDFPGGRPAWDRAGAILTDDAGPWERMKLRALNGVHSALAYLGALAGVETIAEALALPGMPAAMRRLVAEDVAPSFAPPAGQSVVEYGESVLTRFANAAIGHRTLQVAMDGTQKLPQRVLHTILSRRAAGAEPRWAALVVAAWMRFAGGVADDGRALPLDDPLAPTVRAALADAAGTPASVVDALLGIGSVFPPELAADDTVRSLVVGWLDALTRHGVRETLLEAE